MSITAHATNLLDVGAAHQHIAQIVKPLLQSQTINLADALGHITTEAVMAPYALPPFDNTGVDGFAFCHADYISTGLALIGESLAGQPYADTLPHGCAAHIATGAVLPVGADTVAMQEYVLTNDTTITIDPLPPLGSNIRRSGNDVQKDALVLKSRHRLRPQDIALLGALGLTQIKVLRPLRIGILSTGSELQSHGSILSLGQIIDTNSLMLKHLLAGYPVEIDLLGALPDDRAKTDAMLLNASQTHDLIISTGGVSVGRKDFIRDALQTLGKVHFWKLALRPGKPVMFGAIGDCLMLGLPGNPVSVMVTFYIMALPILQALWGSIPSLPRGEMIPLAAPIQVERNLRCFPRGRLIQKNYEWSVLPYRDQSSNLLSSLTETDGLLDIPAGQMDLKVGTSVLFRSYSLFV
jgi:molybdopterin molybdotransferase